MIYQHKNAHKNATKGEKMNIDKEQYKKYAAAHAPKSPIIKDCALAFLFGGVICLIGEFLINIYSTYMKMAFSDASSLSSITLILVAVTLTAVGVFDNIAKLAGAGTLVPITGFANSVAAPAIDSHSEGLVLGVGAKIFTVAGPVLLYGTFAGAIYGVIYWCVSLFFR